VTRVVVTGGSGKLGRAVVDELLAHGYDVVNVDVAPSREPVCPYVRVDLTDYGQTAEALSAVDDRFRGVDAVVHLAAIPAPGLTTNSATFANNATATYNVFAAARAAGITNVVWASSETVLGLPFDTPPPYIPLDEEYPARPESTYSLVKHLEEDRKSVV
jgi:nucleoside-diphosphate-sugar epimerase